MSSSDVSAVNLEKLALALFAVKSLKRCKLDFIKILFKRIIQTWILDLLYRLQAKLRGYLVTIVILVQFYHMYKYSLYLPKNIQGALKPFSIQHQGIFVIFLKEGLIDKFPVVPLYFNHFATRCWPGSRAMPTVSRSTLETSSKNYKCILETRYQDNLRLRLKM